MRTCCGRMLCVRARRRYPSTIVFATSDSIELLCQALVFWYGGRLMASHEYNTIKFFVIYMAVIHGSQAAGMWFSFSPNIAEAAAASNRIISLRPPTAIVGHTDTASIPHLQAEGMGIEFKDVHFTYKGRSIPVIKGLNLKIQPGQFAALVGASGSGKVDYCQPAREILRSRLWNYSLRRARYHVW
jgi:ATP-binding cassette subfamily B (MDR/TAP) protein 1